MAPARGVGGSRQVGWAQHQPQLSLPTPVLTTRSLEKQAGVGDTPPTVTRAELGLRVTQGQQDKVGE